MKVLVVDDERETTDRVCRYLAHRRFTVVAADGVERAVDMLDSDGPFDIILADVRVGPEDSLDLIRACNRLGHQRPTMFLVTGAARSEHASESIKRGLAFASKPFAFRAILEALRILKDRAEAFAVPRIGPVRRLLSSIEVKRQQPSANVNAERNRQA